MSSAAPVMNFAGVANTTHFKRVARLHRIELEPDKTLGRGRQRTGFNQRCIDMKRHKILSNVARSMVHRVAQSLKAARAWTSISTSRSNASLALTTDRTGNRSAK